MPRNTTTRRTTGELRFDDKLVLFHFCLAKFGISNWKRLAEQLNRIDEEGINEQTGRTRFLEVLLHQPNRTISDATLCTYDDNIQRYTKHIGEKRGGITWKYFQYISLMFTEMYLDQYFNDKDTFCAELNDFLHSEIEKSLFQLDFEDFTNDRLNKLAFMCATGSGKTLLLHVNILQFQHYLQAAKRRDSRLGINKVIVLTPNEGMSKQHLDELTLSNIPASIFQKDSVLQADKNEITIIDINKLEEVGKDKTVSVDSFEQNNLLMVDEGHRGLSSGGKVWLDYRRRMAADGFTFEYSATFKQALNNDSRSAADRALVEDYGKSILMDYSYKYFYNDGYGKDYRIFNMKTGEQGDDQRILYLTGCLMSFYQQKKVFQHDEIQLRPFNIENPLLVFVGNRVTSNTSAEELTDVEDVIMFIDQFVRNKQQTIHRIELVLSGHTGLMNSNGQDIFSHDFTPLQDYCTNWTAEDYYDDILRLLFNTTTNADEPRLHLDHIRQAGEIAMRIGEDGEYFGVISIGDTPKLISSCEKKRVVIRQDAFIEKSLFENINKKGSKINVLVGSRKFTEGWNSWRVSTIGLINFAKGEGSQAIQMFGRGVRLKGYMKCLKRSQALESNMHAPYVKHINKLETLTLFGVRANYMEEFKKFLEMEGAPSNDTVCEISLPVLSRYKEVQKKKLQVIRVRQDKVYKRDSRRLLLDIPSQDFHDYLIKNRIIIDCRNRIQSIDVTHSFKIETEEQRNNIAKEDLPILDYYRIYDELEMYKNEKSYFNITIDCSKLLPILENQDWYEFIIPAEQLKIYNLARREQVTDYAIMALKLYMDRYFKFEKERWESQYLEYAELQENDNNFIEEYNFTYTEQGGDEDLSKAFEQFIVETQAILNANGCLDPYERKALEEQLVFFDFRHHLYAPLVCIHKNNMKIQVSPVSLNDGEKLFVDRLNDFVLAHQLWLQDKSLYLLRNKSKTGMGFFEAGNFYPDFIMWIDTPEKQYITFIDPKGLMHFGMNDDKIQFFTKIKQLEKQLAPSAIKPVELNSFIMSSTPGKELRLWWHLSHAKDYEDRNVYTLDDTQCVEKMIEKIMNHGLSA